MSIENFDWQGYMSDIGYAPEQIPNEINDEDLQWLYGLWARDLMEKINYDVRRDPFLSTANEKRAEARKRFLYYAPDLAHFFGDEVQPNDPNSTYDPEEFRQHVINNEVQNANLGYYLDTFAASRINEDTDAKWPWLKGLTKDQFKRHFMEQQDIDEAWTSVDDIRNGNFGTLSAKYQEQLTKQQGLKGNEKSGHMAALKQGWYEFEKLFGYTAGTLGDAMGVQWLSDIGNEIAQNVIQKSDAYNYRSKYNESLADTIKNQGFMAAGGKILNMAEENWATTAAPLALAAIGKILSTYAHVPQPLADAATRAVAANVVRRQGANLLRRASQLAYASSAALSGLEIGGVRAELEEHGKYDPNNVADVVAAGLVSSSLDFVGNVAAMKGIGITASRLWTHRLAVNEARARLAREITEDQAKSFTHRVLSAMAIEGVTEGLQEIPAMVVGARRGIEYTPKEVRDRIIDAAAVGAFMGAGIRAGEIALEKYHRGDGDNTPTPTSTEQEPGETPEAAPQTEPQPPPPGFDGAIPPFVTWRQMENGFSVHDEFNVGYGATHEEAARNFIENANKGRVDIDPNRITFVPGSQAGESWVIARYGENGKNSVKVIGQDKERYIRKIIELHNDPNNAVNLQGDNVFRTDEFRSNNSQLNEDEFIRSILEQKKTKFGSDSRVTAARRDTVDIPVSFDALPRGDRPGTYVTFNLDEDTRTSLRDKGFTILSEPRSKKKGRVQVLRLHRDGFIYTVTLTNNESDQGAHANVKAESIYNLVHGKKGGFSFEGDIGEQVLRVVDTDAVTNLSTSREVKYAVTLSPTLRPGFIEIDREITPEGREGFTFDPRDVLKKRVEAAKGKIERIGERNISYTSAGETTRLDVTADGRVLVSRDGRFIGDYDFVAGDIGDSTERAIVQSSKIEGQQLFHVVDIPEELQFEGRVTFVYRDDLIGGKVTREYFAIKNDGSVHFIPPAEMNYVDKLLRLPHIQNLNDARDVFGHQFIEFYALPEFYNDGEVRQFVGFKTENNLLPAVNLEDPTLHRFDDMQVDELISAGYNEDFVKVYAIIAPNGEIVRATTEEGVDAFISDIKNYANIIDDSEWNPSSRGESIFGDAYIEQGRYTERDLYSKLYSVEEIYVNENGTPFTDEDFNHDSDEIRKVTENIISELDREISSIRDQYKKKKILLADKYIRQYESILSSLKDDLSFFGSSPSQYASQYFSGAREFNEAVRRKFYRLRTAQAMLRIDLYRKKIGSTTSILNTQELERIITEDIGDYKENLALEQLREKAIQAESIAVRLEEAYIKTFPLNDSNKITTLLWETIYPDSTEAKYGSFVNRIHSEGTDFRFSRAAETPRVQRKINLLDELNNDIGTFTLNEMLERGLRGESGGLVILPDQEAAHEIERRFTTDATQPYYDDAGLIQGFVAPDGIMYLVEDGIVDGKARQIILHEYGVHARKFGMSDAQFQEIVQGIKARRDEKSLEGDFVRHCITRAKQANRNMSEDNPIFWEEVAAYAVEDGYHLADTGIVGRMQTWMKNWLWRFGVIDASAFHYQDFVNMAQGMLGNPGPLSFFDGTHDYTKYQDSWKNLPKFSRSILAEDSPDREEFAQRTYRRLRGLDDAIERERNGEDADTIEQATDWRRNDNGNWEHLRDPETDELGGEPELRYSRATAEELKPYSSFINDLEDNLVRERISGVPREGDTVLYQRGDVNEFITRDSLYTIEDADDYYPDLEQRWIDYHRDDSESNFVRYSRSIPESGNSRSVPTGMQKQAGVIYPNMGEEISGFRYSIGKAAREEYRAQLEEGRKDFTPEQIENVLKELDKYHDAKQYKKVKAALHWVIRGRVILPEDEKKIEEAIKTAENAKVDLIGNLKDYESPLDFINKYKEFKPKVPPIDPSTVPEFSDPLDLGDGIITYEVQDTKEGQQAMREIINTHWGEDANPWCLLQGDGKGNLTSDSWTYWSVNYSGLPKRVAFKNGKLLSFMATNRAKDTTIETSLTALKNWISSGKLREVLYQYSDNKVVSEYLNYSNLVKSLDFLRTLLRRGNGIFVYEAQSNYGINYLRDENLISEDLRSKLDDAFNNQRGREIFESFERDRTEWLRAVEDAIGELITSGFDRIRGNFDRWLENDAFKISYLDDSTAVIVDESGKRIDIAPLWYTPFSEEFRKQDDGTFIARVQMPEQWWDRNDESHPNLDWARDTPVSGLRYSRAATIDDVPQTPRQRGTQVPNAPGMYKMPDGSLHIEPSELPVGFESETILYAAIAISDPAKEEPKVAELREFITADENLMRLTDQMMEQRKDTNEDHRLGYAVSLILEAYDPASDIYQHTVDAFHEAVSKATGGAYQNLILDTGQIEAAAHAAAGIPYEPLLTAPQETVPTPRPNTADMEHLRRQEMFAASDAQRAEMQVGEDGRAYISTDDSDVDVVFESKVNSPFDTGRLVDDVLIGASRQGEDDDFYNHLADSPHHGTQEPLDSGRFALPADQNRQEVERFLADSIPEHIWRRVEILWEDNPENNAILGNALGLFKPRSWKNKNIFIKGWNRSFGQVVRTAAREASRFGWGMWQNRDFRRAITDFYDMFQAKIYDELRPYYNQMGITDPAQLSDGQKIYMVQTFFSKMNQSLFTDDQGNMGDVLGIPQTEYNRILADVRSGLAAQERDLSAFVEGVANDPELAKRFAAEMLRMTMEASTKMGVHFTYERSSRLGGKDRIRVFTNEWGTYRRKIPNTRFGNAAEEIKNNLRWWRERFNAGEGAEKFARQIMRNLPMSMRYPLEWMHLYVPHARLGDTTLGRASQMISRVWQRIGDTSGTTLARDYALMEDIHGILRAHNYDPLMADDMGDRTYREFFQGLGITSEKDLKKADMADAIVTTAERLKTEGEARIRETIMETGLSLWNRMLDADFSQRDVNDMVDRFEGYRQRFMLDHYSHRMYEAFTPEGKRELSMLLNYLRRDPRTGEHTLAKRAKEARDAIARAQARYGAATSEFYRETKEARDDLRRWERLQHLWNREMGNAKKYKGLVGAELNAKVVEGMERYILAIVSDSKTHGRFDPQAVPHYNAISAQKARRLDPDNPLDKELMDFLLEIKDPIRKAVYTLDQQRQLITKLEFNKELGEYLLDNNMAGLRSQPDADGLARDLAHMETGSFLEYVSVDPEFMPEIKAEWENMQKVTDTVLSGLTDAVKANSTVYSLRLMMNNYIGNASMLLASGHIWRFKDYLTAGEVIRKQFLDRFTYGAKDPSDFAKMILREMEQNMVTGGSGTEMSVFQLNKGAHERFVQTMTQMLYAVTPLTKRGKFKMDNFVAKLLEKARAFYTYGDEWVKPLIYLNNRASAIAKYQAIEKRYEGETEEDYQERVLKKAIEEASEQTIRETVSWENSPFFVRQLSTRSVRFFAPDFLLHNFQMLRITAANYVRWFGALDELRNFDPSQMNPDKVEAYRSELKKELVRRGVGGAMTAGVYAGLIGATGSCMAYIPYMMNTLMAAIDGEDDKDKDNTFFNPQEWEGAQRILNYKTGGDNFFVPAWRHDGKIYAWNYGRASVMLTHAIPQPATENPEFRDYAAQFFKNIVAIGGGTIAQEIVNNFQGKDKWGRDIGVEAGWWRIFDRVFVPGAVKQLMDMSVGYPGSDNPYREGKAIKMSDAVGITVNAYDMRDIVNELAWDMARVGSNSQNVVRKSFVKRLTQSDALSDSDVASMIGDMREDNARHMDRANYLLTGLRQMGMENKELQHWLTTSRKDAGNILSKKQATAFLKGHNVYDDALVTYLKNKRNNLAKGKDDVRMSRKELDVVLQNYDKAIRIYSQALRAQ